MDRKIILKMLTTIYQRDIILCRVCFSKEKAESWKMGKKIKKAFANTI